MSPSPTLLWFRQDLRLRDNLALQAAVARGGAILPLFILDDAGEGQWPLGAASRWWLHHSLEALDETLRERGSRLIFARGDTRAVLREMIAGTGAEAVYWNRRYEPAAVRRDAWLKEEFAAAGIEARSFNSALLFEPHTVANKSGNPFQVFTPFWRHCAALPIARPQRFSGKIIPVPARWPASRALAELELQPKPDWATGLRATWEPGEAGARKRLVAFIERDLAGYESRRDRPDEAGTSMLSPHLRFGEIGPRQIWAAVESTGKSAGVFPPSAGAAAFLRELGWREFAYHLLFHFPHTPESPLRPAFARFRWGDDPGREKRSAWQRGRTGYPIVDAGLRQLWATGWMHNRVRMIVASFLVKHLRLPWTEGAAWFWDTLVDADLANNSLGWQWSAGCGADAAPYFRIFSPMLQGEKFDAAGEYVRRWVPELSGMPTKYIHRPWEAPGDVLQAAGVRLGETYPHPIVDHAAARAAALEAYRELGGGQA